MAAIPGQHYTGTLLYDQSHRTPSKIGCDRWNLSAPDLQVCCCGLDKTIGYQNSSPNIGRKATCPNVFSSPCWDTWYRLLGPLVLIEINEIMTWTSNQNRGFLWDIIAHPYANFFHLLNCGWKFDYIPHVYVDVISYPCHNLNAGFANLR